MDVGLSGDDGIKNQNSNKFNILVSINIIIKK